MEAIQKELKNLESCDVETALEPGLEELIMTEDQFMKMTGLSVELILEGAYIDCRDIYEAVVLNKQVLKGSLFQPNSIISSTFDIRLPKRQHLSNTFQKSDIVQLNSICF